MCLTVCVQLQCNYAGIIGLAMQGARLDEPSTTFKHRYSDQVSPSMMPEIKRIFAKAPLLRAALVIVVYDDPKERFFKPQTACWSVERDTMTVRRCNVTQ